MALTNAEKQARWRAKRNALAEQAIKMQAAGKAGYVTDEAKARIAELEAENTKLKAENAKLKAKAKQPDEVIAGLDAGKGDKARIAELEAALKATLSMTAQQKLDASIRAEKRRLGAQFQQAVQQKYQRDMDEQGLPHLHKMIAEAQKILAEAKRIMDARRGFMTKDTFNTIRRALHPDSRGSISDQRLGHAFDEFMRLEKYLLKEQDSPTTYPNLPHTMAEWDEMRRRATAARKTKRDAKRNSVARR